MLTQLRSGYCFGCNKLTWRAAVAQRNDDKQGIVAGVPHILWPSPDSFYVTIDRGDSLTPGIGFCPDCLPMMFDRISGLSQPARGDIYEWSGRVVAIESAYARYVDWYSDGREKFYRDWFRDALSLDAPTIDALMALWKSDRDGRHRNADQ